MSLRRHQEPDGALHWTVYCDCNRCGRCVSFGSGVSRAVAITGVRAQWGWFHSNDRNGDILLYCSWLCFVGKCNHGTGERADFYLGKHLPGDEPVKIPRFR